MEDRINSTAEKLTLMFSDELDIPSRFKKRKDEKSKINLNSMIEQRFKENCDSWKHFINVILSKVQEDQAWRFITLTPQIEEGIRNVTLCKDFQAFTHYFVLRRDVEKCSDMETGQLAMLHSAFQKKIENKLINSQEK